MCRNDKLSWLFNNRLNATRQMKVKRMGICNRNFEKLRIRLIFANRIKSSESFSKQPTQLIITAHNCHIWLLKSWVNLDKDVSNMFIYQVSQLRSMRVTRRIVLTLLTKTLYKFGCCKEKNWSSLKFWIWQRCYFTKLPWDDFACTLVPFSNPLLLANVIYEPCSSLSLFLYIELDSGWPNGSLQHSCMC